MKEIVIVGAKRTAIGNFGSVFRDITCPALGASAIEAAVNQAGINPETVDETLMGCVLPAGLGQAPARQAMLEAGLSEHCPATTINKMCGSGLKAIMLARDAIQTNSAQIVVAGGMENMTRAPYLLQKARHGYRLGHGELKDHMFLDGLEDAYDKGTLMGVFAEHTAQELGFTREKQDAFAIESVHRARKASAENYFAAEITPVTVVTSNQSVVINKDEGPETANLAKIPQLKPAFSKNGTITAANASSISDGAAAVVLISAELAHKKKLNPLAKIVGQCSFAQAPAHFTTAPIGAIENLLKQIGWSLKEVDLFEINEAFAVVTLACMEKLNLDPAKVNVNGGACVLGHPIGASGARILVTLIYALKTRRLKKGVATLCIGGGEAVAIAIEII
ncbi:MAG: acetyl-CoA acetyltransferase [Coxiella sp. RIFCSPHIGHO2_12_FULL_44_14]|nr:MAG: acetyl-CoA acetyltransferase [Coxiella sp. RIFCSPHIGHO2_12_FULL_44_14]